MLGKIPVLEYFGFEESGSVCKESGSRGSRVAPRRRNLNYHDLIRFWSKALRMGERSLWGLCGLLRCEHCQDAGDVELICRRTTAIAGEVTSTKRRRR